MVGALNMKTVQGFLVEDDESLTPFEITAKVGDIRKPIDFYYGGTHIRDFLWLEYLLQFPNVYYESSGDYEDGRYLRLSDEFEIEQLEFNDDC